MAQTKLSSKYQIVIPKAIREKLGLTEGMTVTINPIDDARAVISKLPLDHVQALKGLGKDIWQKLGGGDVYLKNERAAWEK